MLNIVGKILTDSQLSLEARHVLAVMLIYKKESVTITEMISACAMSQGEVDFAFKALKTKGFGKYERGTFTLRADMFPEEKPKKTKKKAEEQPA